MRYPHKAQAQDVAAPAGPGVRQVRESPSAIDALRATHAAMHVRPGSAAHRAADPAGYAAWLDARNEMDLPEWTRPEGRGSAAGAGAKPPLGIKRKNVGHRNDGEEEKQTEKKDLKEKRRELLRELYADQRTAAKIYHSMAGDEPAAGRGVCLCGWTRISEKPVELLRVEEKEGPRAFYAGLSKCGLRWVCPICTRAASEEAREKLNLALAAARAQGAVPVMVTLTARHHRDMPLKEFWARLSLAEKRLKALRAWKEMNAADGPMLGFAKAVEATHGKNGWHPHFHWLAVMRSADEDEAMAALSWLKSAWLRQLERVGLDGASDAARKRAFQIQGAAAAGAYVTKWGAAEELALAGAKSGRDGGRTPWELLRDARVQERERDRQAAAALWWEFVQAFKGVHQIRLSPGLKALIAQHQAENPPPDEEAEEKPDPATVITFGQAEWEIGRWRRLTMREAAEDAPREQARNAVLAVLMGEMTDRDLIEPDPGPLIEDG